MENRPDSTCSCPTCQQMCKNSPCFPTPEEAVNLMNAGYTDRLAISVFADQQTGEMHPAITAQFTTQDGCTFQNEAGLCELHHTGLKPVEGRKAHHSLSDSGLRQMVCKTWHSKQGIDVINSFPTTDLLYQSACTLTLRRHMAATQQFDSITK